MTKDHKHCPASADGKHEPDPTSIAPADGTGRNRGVDFIIDVRCRRCSESGSMFVDPKDIQWD